MRVPDGDHPSRAFEARIDSASGPGLSRPGAERSWTPCSWAGRCAVRARCPGPGTVDCCMCDTFRQFVAAGRRPARRPRVFLGGGGGDASELVTETLAGDKRSLTSAASARAAAATRMRRAQ